jgi:hypothetical protein
MLKMYTDAEQKEVWERELERLLSVLCAESTGAGIDDYGRNMTIHSLPFRPEYLSEEDFRLMYGSVIRTQKGPTVTMRGQVEVRKSQAELKAAALKKGEPLSAAELLKDSYVYDMLVYNKDTFAALELKYVRPEFMDKRASNAGRFMLKRNAELESFEEHVAGAELEDHLQRVLNKKFAEDEITNELPDQGLVIFAVAFPDAKFKVASVCSALRIVGGIVQEKTVEGPADLRAGDSRA